MSEVKEIEVREGRTISTGNWESFRVDVGARAVLEPGEDLNEAFYKLFQEVEKQLIVRVRTERERVLESQEEKAKERFRGRRRIKA